MAFFHVLLNGGKSRQGKNNLFGDFTMEINTLSTFSVFTQYTAHSTPRQHNGLSLAACWTPNEGKIVCIYFASVYCASTSIVPEAKANSDPSDCAKRTRRNRVSIKRI